MEPFSYWLIGGSAGDPTTRNVGWGLKAAGWTGFVNAWVPQIRGAGYKRIWLHNPFGTEGATGGMSFFQAIHAAAQAPFLVQDFVEAWSAVTAAGIEVVAYVGTILSVTQRSDQGIKEVIQEAIGPMIAAGCSLGFDYSFSMPAGSPPFKALQYLKSLGIRCYLEPGVATVDPHLWAFDQVIAYDYWSQGYQTQRAQYAPDGPSVTGEKVMLLQQATDAGMALAQAKEAIAAGYTPAIPPGLIKRTDLPV